MRSTRSFVPGKRWRAFAGLLLAALAILAIDPAPGPRPARAQTAAASRPYAILLCQFADVAATYDVAPQRIQDMFVGNDLSLSNYFREVSLGAVNLDGSVAWGWFPMGSPQAAYTADGGAPDTAKLAKDCSAAAVARGVDLSPFAYVAFFTNGVLAGAQGIQSPNAAVDLPSGTKTVSGVFLEVRGLVSPPLVLHEIGHAFGAAHTSNTSDPLGEATNGDNPARPRWPLPLKASNPGPGYGAYNRDQMGFIPAARKASFAGGTQTYTLTRLTQPGTGPMMVEIPFGTSGTSRFIVSARTRVGFDGLLKYPEFTLCASGCPSSSFFGFGLVNPGVQIERVDDPPAGMASTVMQPPGAAPGDTVNWTAGQTYTDSGTGITIAVTRFDDTGADITVTGPARP